jgi:GGDEF domain-containing protein
MKKNVETRQEKKFKKLFVMMKSLRKESTLSQEMYALFQQMKSDLVSSQLDSLTELLYRSVWYASLRDVLLKEYPHLRSVQLGESEDVQTFTHTITKSKNKIVICFCDMAYLRLANAHGHHDQGDALIQSVGVAFSRGLGRIHSRYRQSVFIGRLGGDEFCVLFQDVPAYQRRLLFQSAGAFIQKQVISNLHSFGLIPHFDYGSASFDEAWLVLSQMIQKKQTLKTPQFNFCMDALVNIADMRSTANKMFVRLQLLLRLKERVVAGKMSKSEYKEVLPFLTSSCDVTEEELIMMDEFRTEAMEKNSYDAKNRYRNVLMQWVRSSLFRGTKSVYDNLIFHQALANFR